MHRPATAAFPSSSFAPELGTITHGWQSNDCCQLESTTRAGSTVVKMVDYSYKPIVSHS